MSLSAKPAARQHAIHIEQLRKSYSEPAAGDVHYIIKDVDLVIKGGNSSCCSAQAAAANPRC